LVGTEPVLPTRGQGPASLGASGQIDRIGIILGDERSKHGHEREHDENKGSPHGYPALEETAERELPWGQGRSPEGLTRPRGN